MDCWGIASDAASFKGRSRAARSQTRQRSNELPPDVEGCALESLGDTVK